MDVIRSLKKGNGKGNRKGDGNGKREEGQNSKPKKAAAFGPQSSKSTSTPKPPKKAATFGSQPTSTTSTTSTLNPTDVSSSSAANVKFTNNEARMKSYRKELVSIESKFPQDSEKYRLALADLKNKHDGYKQQIREETKRKEKLMGWDRLASGKDD